MIQRCDVYSMSRNYLYVRKDGDFVLILDSNEELGQSKQKKTDNREYTNNTENNKDHRELRVH